MIKKLLPALLLLCQLANAGLPPTSSKGSNDANPVTTFEFDFPNFPLTHTGTKASVGVLGVAGGGTNLASYTLGDILYASGATTLAKLGVGAAHYPLTVSSGIPSWGGPISMNSTQINGMADPTLAQDAATKSYVDTQLLQLNPAAAVYAASTANIAGTYTNAVGGICIGDTFTITATGALSLDGTSPGLGARVLLKNQSSSFQDGVWTVTVVGTTGVSPVLTRALDFDSSADINAGQIVPIVNGTVNAGASWYQTATVTTCSSDSQTWTQFQKASSAYASSTLTSAHIYVGNGSNLAADVAVSNDATMANTGALTLANTAVTPASYTNTNLTVDSKGRITAASNGSSSSATSPTDQQNYGFSTSVGSSALTINLKQADGSTDPGAGAAAAIFSFRSATAATGSYTQVSSTAATSIVVPSGATLGQTSAVNQYIWVYAINNAGTVELAVAGVTPTFDKEIVSTTAIGAGSTSGSVLYSTTARTNVASRLIGRLLVNESTAGTWASNASNVVAGVQPIYNATASTSYTPTIGADYGSASSIAFKYRRDGEYLFVQGTFITGTVTTGLGGISIPSGLNIDTNKISVVSDTSVNCPKFGDWYAPHANSNGPIIVAGTTSTTVVYSGNQDDTVNKLQPTSFGSVGFSNALFSLQFQVPISGWSAYGP